MLWRVIGRGEEASEADAATCWQQWDAGGRCQPGQLFTYHGVEATVISIAFAGGNGGAKAGEGDAGIGASLVHAAAQRADIAGQLTMPSSFARALAATWLGVADEPQLPRQATPVEIACGVWWLAALSDAMQWAAQVEPSGPPSSGDAISGAGDRANGARVAITWSIAMPGTPMPSVHTVTLALRRTFAVSPMSAVPRRPPLWKTIAAMHPISIGSATMTVAERRRLALGSYVVGLARHAPRLIVGGASWSLAPAHPWQTTYRVISEAEPMKQDESMATALLAHGRTPLSVVIGHVELSFDQLSSLAPGSLIRLAREPSPHATLYMGGTAIADVELVDAQGQLAARIISVRNQADPSPSAG